MIRQIMRCCVFVFSVLGMMVVGSAFAASDLGVCAVVNDGAHYNGDEITIHANVVASIHGILASDDKCGMACGVISIVVPVSVYKKSIHERKILALQTNTGFYHVIVTGKFTHKRVGNSRVCGILRVTRILLWKPIKAPWKPPGRGD